LADRINRLCGETVAMEWNGVNQLDPQAPGETMCRLGAAAEELLKAGGKLQLLCSSRTSCCPHHPTVAGAQACGYQRQQLQAHQNVRIWIVPSNMLASAPPPALQRGNRLLLGDFDVLVIDEAPWLNLLGDGDIPVTYLDPGWWKRQAHRAGPHDSDFLLQVFAKLHHLLATRDFGEVPESEFFEAGFSAADLKKA
jgi:hypothetical protein